MKRPSFQFYPADWRNNAKLRRCSEAARGAWMDVLCILHDSDEYGVCRWPLGDLARASGVHIKLLKELADKDVLKGGDKGCTPYIYTPRSGGKDGAPVTLITATEGNPCWYSSRFVRDEYIRNHRGQSSQFSSENQPPKKQPKGGLGEREGNGSSSSSSSSSKNLSVTNVTGGEPPKITDPEEIIFGYGLTLLVSAGTPDKNARSFLGGLRKAHGDTALIDKLRECAKAKPLQPVEWLAAAMPPGGTTSKTPPQDNFANKNYGTEITAL